MIKIQIVSDNGLTKEEWGFCIQGHKLVYSSYFTYKRRNRRERWADELPPPLSISAFCNKYGLDEYNYYDQEEYKKYRDKNNPVLKGKLKGTIAQIKDMPKCTERVAAQAKAKFIEQLEVIYE